MGFVFWFLPMSQLPFFFVNEPNWLVLFRFRGLEEVIWGFSRSTCTPEFVLYRPPEDMALVCVEARQNTVKWGDEGLQEEPALKK